MTKKLTPHLQELENEAIMIIREAYAAFERPVLLFSGGKDSITMLHLALKAFVPMPLPFPLMHIDTGHNFAETLDFRDNLMKKHGLKLIVGSVEESIKKGSVEEETGADASRIRLQTTTLLESIAEHNFDCCFGGARRDEEKARAKERFFSHRNPFGQWEPKNQRPELWHLFNGAYKTGENFRVFPLSNWTEADIWEYIESEELDMPNLYFAHKRDCVIRHGVILYNTPVLPKWEGEESKEMMVRFRTIGDMTSTGAVESTAKNVTEIIQELKETQISERGARADDKRSESSMEERKRQGYF